MGSGSSKRSVGDQDQNRVELGGAITRLVRLCRVCGTPCNTYWCSNKCFFEEYRQEPDGTLVEKDKPDDAA